MQYHYVYNLAIVCIIYLLNACNHNPIPTTTISSSSHIVATHSSNLPLDNILPHSLKWQLVWQDEFNEKGLPSAQNWSFEEQPAGWVNNELQHYVGANLKNVRQADGNLIIEARRAIIDGKETYTSARIHSQKKAEWLYGRIEARIKIPKGKGTWPAFWMMPTNIWKYATTCSSQTGWTQNCDAWPNSGEIDIMEHVGKTPGTVHASVHSADYYFKLGNHRTAHYNLTTATDSFHVYAVEWNTNQLDFFVDSVKILTVKNDQSGWKAWPFDQPFYLIFNLAIGGDWGGTPDSTIFTDSSGPKLYVDYVRVYKLP